MSHITHKRGDTEIDTVAFSEKHFGDRRAFDVLMEAQHYWNQMDDFRHDRERNKRYTYGFQWDDVICVDGKKMSEEDYIKAQGNVPLKNNLIRRLVRNVLGVYRSQLKERPARHATGTSRNWAKPCQPSCNATCSLTA